MVRGVNEEGEEFELRLGMCALDVARGGLMVGPPAGSMTLTTYLLGGRRRATMPAAQPRNGEKLGVPEGGARARGIGN
jgi:hypothetical protein